MFGADDDDDFAPGSSSKLASLFGLGKPAQEGNSSLTYTAPKQPKKGRPESQSVSGQSTSSPAKLSIITVKAVHTYKLADGNYNAQGKLGAAVLGNAASQVYQLLLYKGKQQHVTSTRITPAFQFVVQANNYATFYDDQTQNWSIMFESSDEAVDFAREVGLARANSGPDQGDHNFVTQDLLFGVGATASEGDSVEVRYIAYPLTAEGKLGQELENTTKLDKPQRVKLKKGGWEEGLVGMAKGCRRMVVLPPTLASPWKSKVSSDCGVVLEVDIGRIKSARVSSLTDSGGDSAVDSSTDDTSIKARGASISEALTNSPKTHKASIISRMARMGQATLPLKGAVVCNPSDSEDTEEEPPEVPNKTPVKVRMTKSRPVPQAQESPAVQTQTNMGGLLPPHQVSVYQPMAIPWQQAPQQPPQQQQFMQRTNGSMAYPGQLFPMVAPPQQVFPSTPPAVPSPDSHLSVFLAETRTQNSEVRMGMAKVVDKVDQVLFKLDGMQHRQSLPNMAGTMEPSALLGSIQRLVSDNESLRAELEDRRDKMERQSDKMYELLHQSSGMMDASVVMALQQEKTRLATELGEAVSRTGSAVQELKVQQAQLEASRRTIQEQELRLQAALAEVQACSKCVCDLREEKEALERRLLETQRLSSAQEAATQELKSKLASQEQDSSSRHHQVDKEWSRKLAEVNMKVKELFQENATLRERQAENSGVLSEVKNVMNLVFRTLQPQFVPDTSYDGSTVRQTLLATIRDVTLKYIEAKTGKPAVPQDRKPETVVEHTSKTAVAESTGGDDVRLPRTKDKPAMASSDMQLPETEGKRSTAANTASDEKQEPEKIPVETAANNKQEPEKNPAETAANNKQEPEKNPAETASDEKQQTLKNLVETAAKKKQQPVKNPFETACDEKHPAETAANKKQEPAETASDEKQQPVKNPGDEEPVASCDVQRHEPETDTVVEETPSVPEPPADVPVSEGTDVAAEQARVDQATSIGPTGDTLQAKQSRESSLERSWRPQPPPPPLFDDEDEDDDWLK